MAETGDFYLDASCISSDSIESERTRRLIANIRDVGGRIRLSFINISELLNTRDPHRRRMLMDAAFLCGEDEFLLADTRTLLARAAKHALDPTISFSPDFPCRLREVEPRVRDGRKSKEEILEDSRRSFRAAADKMEVANAEAKQMIAELEQDLALEGHEPCPELQMRFRCSAIAEGSFLHRLINLALEREVNFIERSIIASNATWRATFSATAYWFYCRNVRKERYAAKRNAGWWDVMQTIYMPHCDHFVTRDDPFFEFLQEYGRHFRTAFAPSKMADIWHMDELVD